MMVSDQGPQFAPTYWGQICGQLGMDRWMSIAFHPPTVGQTEHMNSITEYHLQVFVSHQQDDWVQ